MSALGIAIGIATMISVIGISASGQEQLLRQLDRLGTNLLRVEPGQSFSGDPVKLHPDAALMVRRIAGVTDAGATGTVAATIRRTDRVPKEDTGGLTVQATSLDLLDTLDGRVGTGRWLDEAIARRPAVVLGAVAARRLGFDGHPTTVHERSTEESVAQVRGMLARTVSPERPHEVAVSRPSDALAAHGAALGAGRRLRRHAGRRCGGRDLPGDQGLPAGSHGGPRGKRTSGRERGNAPGRTPMTGVPVPRRPPESSGHSYGRARAYIFVEPTLIVVQ